MHVLGGFAGPRKHFVDRDICFTEFFLRASVALLGILLVETLE